MSFYIIESSVINNKKYDNIRAAYLYYYATEVGLTPQAKAKTEDSKAALKTRLNELIHDMLILAKKYDFDVFNALTLMDNGLFLDQQKFGGGDGQLHFYLYNYNANPIAGGVDRENKIDKDCSGMGLVML
jgi:glycylpeptide N-tetradecanoyltransferase